MALDRSSDERTGPDKRQHGGKKEVRGGCQASIPPTNMGLLSKKKSREEEKGGRRTMSKTGRMETFLTKVLSSQ